MLKVDKIIRTNRKSFALIIERDGALVVRAPNRATDSQIMKLVTQKEGWIKKKQQIARSKSFEVMPKEYVEGETFLYLGKRYQLVIEKSQSEPLKLNRSFYISENSISLAESVFTEWYRFRARKVFIEMLDWYATNYGFKYQKLRLSNAKTRWGSCGAKGSINLVWRLVMAPIEVVDYVILHELVHTVEMNHSKKYWTKVGNIMPDYKIHRDWLKENGATLTL